jgi:hypothetical protein
MKLVIAEVLHGLAPDANVRMWQDRLTPMWKRIGGGFLEQQQCLCADRRRLQRHPSNIPAGSGEAFSQTRADRSIAVEMTIGIVLAE